MNKTLEELLSKAPEALITISIIILIIYVLREYRKIREENEQSIKDVVNAKLGEIMSNIQTEISRLEIISKDQETKLIQVNEKYDIFSNEIEDKTNKINRIYQDAQEKLQTLREAIPNVDEYSARDLLGMAQGYDSPQTKAELCSRILNHEDATSKELELAGDMMRKSHRYTLAMKLYESAYNKDPERIGAHIELLSLKSEIQHEGRDHSLSIAKSLVIKKPSESGFSRVSNALIDLERYEELNEFSENLILSIDDKKPKLKVLALRNKGVSKREIGDIEGSIQAFQQAFAINPKDENILKPYLGILEEQGKDNEYLELSKKLIDIDPSDINYYRIYISALIKREKYSEASIWLNRTNDLRKSKMDEAMLKSYSDKISAAINNTTNTDNREKGQE